MLVFSNLFQISTTWNICKAVWQILLQTSGIIRSSLYFPEMILVLKWIGSIIFWYDFFFFFNVYMLLLPSKPKSFWFLNCSEKTFYFPLQKVKCKNLPVLNCYSALSLTAATTKSATVGHSAALDKYLFFFFFHT